MEEGREALSARNGTCSRQHACLEQRVGSYYSVRPFQANYKWTKERRSRVSSLEYTAKICLMDLHTWSPGGAHAYRQGGFILLQFCCLDRSTIIKTINCGFFSIKYSNLNISLKNFYSGFLKCKITN